MKWMRSFLLVWITSCGLVAADEATFTNPVAAEANDPWVVRDHDAYYYCFSRNGAVWVSASKSLIGVMREKPVEAWRPEPGKPWSKEIWAPELHHLDGAWYIYVAADDGDNAHHRMQVLRRRDPSPLGAFEHVGPLALPENKWSIDGTMLIHKGKFYHVWSGWEGSENVRQNLYICAMSDPVTPVGKRVLISKPELDWETRGGHPLINEGPTALSHEGRSFIIYSASGSWSDFYCLGLLELTGEDPLDPKAWKKHPQAWFESTAEVKAPGHASFTTSPDGRENWIVYHTAVHPGAGWKRQGNLQPFTYDPATGLPKIDAPVAPGKELRFPSGDSP